MQQPRCELFWREVDSGVVGLCGLQPGHTGFLRTLASETTSHRNVFVCRPEECQSVQPTWTPMLFSSCEAELEEVIVHESEQRRTRRQVLILSPLQNQRGRRCNNATFTSSCFGKPIPQQIKLCQRLVRERIRHYDRDPN